jgi:NhaC family Na+:H+ antiporter
MSPTPRDPTLGESLAAVVLSATLISAGLLVYAGEVPVPILLAAACLPTTALALRTGRSWNDLEGGLVHGMSLALQPLAILMVVGATVASWAASGTIAQMIDLGLALLGPAMFLPASALICGVVSLAIGSSWATAGTVGVALMGIGEALGVPAPMSAGAVISGAYFGDKMSPLSDTTNLAPGMVGVGLFDHIRAMVATTAPSAVLALIGFALLGAAQAGRDEAFDPSSVQALRAALASGQQLSPALLLPPVLVIGLALRRVQALPALVVAALLGVAFAWSVQGVSFGTLLAELYSGHVSETGDAAVDRLLSRGGVASMHDTIALILAATAFGGLLERGGFIGVLLEALLARVRTPGGLIGATIGSSVGINFLIAEQYLAIVLPGRMFRDAYERYGLAPEMLSRSLEDAGTVTSPLCPWNSCGAYMAATLGVATFQYAPFALFNLLMPVVALVYAATGWFIVYREPRAA